jgi:hypothetical protein
MTGSARTEGQPGGAATTSPCDARTAVQVRPAEQPDLAMRLSGGETAEDRSLPVGEGAEQRLPL